MPERLTAKTFRAFSKAKNQAPPSRVMGGGLRAVYLHPEDALLVEGYDVNGTREPAAQSESSDSADSADDGSA